LKLLHFKTLSCVGEANVGYNSDFYACHIHRIAKDWKNIFLDGNVIVPEENNIAFPFGIAQVCIFYTIYKIIYNPYDIRTYNIKE
jgi:hypothetical protein